MRIGRGAGGAPGTTFEVGDLVRLVADEPGPTVTAFAGEWGRVLRADGRGRVDVRLAGYARPRTDGLRDAIALPARVVEPCDHRGRPLDLPHGERWAPRVRSG
jgi:hypothetical protein